MLSCFLAGEADSVVESLTDTDSVRGLGETTDFLNMVRDQIQIDVQSVDLMLILLFLFVLIDACDEDGPQ